MRNDDAHITINAKKGHKKKRLPPLIIISRKIQSLFKSEYPIGNWGLAREKVEPGDRTFCC